MDLGPGDEQAPSVAYDDEDDSHLYGIEEGYDPLLVETSDETADADDAYHTQGMRDADRRWGRRTEWT
jgi:hypothetical protein